jgi:protocatechuate 3,4-dioxygenase beta subunit
MPKNPITRRQALGAAGVTGAALLVGGGRSSLRGLVEQPEAAAAATCTLTPSMTEGPYWVDELLNRSDIRANADGSSVQDGIPLTLTIYVERSETCEPEAGATVDVWHANASGVYSDESVESTSGQSWLRGYQVTDSEGKVTFTTIFPGWYAGRTFHVHVRIRSFDGSSTTYNFTTQIFFDEAINSAVNSAADYSARGTRTTTNTADSIYSADSDSDGLADGSETTISLSGDTSSGYSGSIVFALSGLPSSGSGSGSGTGSETEDTAARASLGSWRWRRTRSGRRVLAVKVVAREKVSAGVRIVRQGRVLGHARGSGLRKGNHVLHVPVGRHVHAGPAKLRLTVEDAAGNAKHVVRELHVPRRR